MNIKTFEKWIKCCESLSNFYIWVNEFNEKGLDCLADPFSKPLDQIKEKNNFWCKKEHIFLKEAWFNQII